ncbi:uncharacterized protein HaLaN_32080, partial [Haematococcus lacustris]
MDPAWPARSPFVLEISQARQAHPPDHALRALEAAMEAADHGVKVVGLTPCTREALERIKEAEDSKQKTYQALCWCSRPLDAADEARLLAVQDVKVLQDTPVRVLHRRAAK